MIKSKDSGQVDPKRTWIITGRERHVSTARTDYLPYPQRALRTKDYPYIINFKPDRWPIGNPYGIEGDRIPTYEKLRDDIHATFKDMDANPTKAWLVTNGKKPEWGKHYELAFGKRPKEKLYILASDPDQINNVALKSEYESVRKKLHDQLMAELKRTGDPRVMGDGSTFDKLPYTRR